MKNKFIILFLPSLFLILLWGCKKEENKIYYEGGTPPVLTASRTGSIPLSFLTKDQEAITISWTNPDYKFTTGLSSQNVSYQLELDTTGANFTNPNRKTISISNDLSLSLTQNELNDYLLNQLQLSTSMPHNIEFRVKSTIGTSLPLYSNVLKFTATPYAIPPKVPPPSTGQLFIIGSATPGGDATGWNNPVPVPSQQFTQVSPTLYRITIQLFGGKSYLFIPENGSWGAKYGAMGANNSNNPNGDDFKPQGGDMISPAATGVYTIEVDFQRGKFTVKQ
jgi:hypothetical protein